MTHERQGWSQRWRKGQQRAQTANLADLAPRLEGPGSKARLRAIQRRFRQLSAKASRPSALQLTILAVLVFLSVLSLGLLVLPPPAGPNS